jgi:hypothetical protein
VLLVSSSFAVDAVSCGEAAFWYEEGAGSEYIVTMKDDLSGLYKVSVAGGF